MMARTAVGNPVLRMRIVLPALIVICCMIFSGALYAETQADAETEPAANEAPDVEAQTATADDTAAIVDTELEAILKKNNRCLRCHTKDRSKTLENGEELSLKIHSDDYTSSAHGEIACVSCHEAIGNRRHPSKKTNITITSKRDYSLEMNQSCRACHDKKFTQYEGSIHSSLVSQGSEKAPLCTDCHSAHAVERMRDFRAETGYPCKKCHENIYTAYSASVHGSARSTGNVIRDEHIEAPICSDCHNSHGVAAVEIGDTLRSQCFGCHENVPLLHSQWLPNAGKHLDIVSCAVCHAPFAKHRFDLHFYDNVAQAPLGNEEGHEAFQQQLKLLEEQEGSIDPLEVWKLIEEKTKTAPSNVSLRGRLEVMSGVWAHQIAPKSFAVRTCDSCHLPGHRQRMGVTVSVPQAGGTVRKFDTSAVDLATVGTDDSTSKFFGVRSVQSKLLDIMALLAFIAGIAIPVGHYTLGQMIKEKVEMGED
jgi:hypothetical protein